MQARAPAVVGEVGRAASFQQQTSHLLPEAVCGGHENALPAVSLKVHREASVQQGRGVRHIVHAKGVQHLVVVVGGGGSGGGV